MGDPALPGGPAPLLFFYTHLHDAIRSELDTLSEAVLALESQELDSRQIAESLSALKARYRFLEQVYKYHSSVEDEVVYPVLDLKVKNVTRAYSVEHEDEEHLLEELLQLLSKAAAACSAVADGSAPGTAPDAPAALRQLVRKVEEVHTTLRKHLAKEEHQLLPLLLQHFEFSEQAGLVAQFLCCIPLAAVRPVLTWIKRTIPLEEQAALQRQVQAVVPDRLLRQLLFDWLAPEAAAPGGGGGGGGEARPGDGAAPRTPETSEGAEFVCCGACKHKEDDEAEVDGGSGGGPCSHDVEDAAGPSGRDTPSSGRPPLREILYFHQAIRSALSSFAEEARALRDDAGGGGGAQLAALVERHRFIRAVCLFHSSSEDEIVFPALRRVGASGSDHSCEPMATTAAATAPSGAAAAQRHRCEDDHINETAQFEELGRLLGDVRACVRRGARGVEALTQDLASVADRLARAMSRHMAREESEVLPPLMRSLCLAEQRHIVWRLVRAMPLRLLERVMPWVAGKLREDDVNEWLGNISRAAPAEEAPLVELLSQWARRGAAAAAAGASSEGKRSAEDAEDVPRWRRGTDDPAAYSIETCTPGVAAAGRSGSGEAPPLDAPSAAAVAAAAAAAAGPPLKRIRTTTGSALPRRPGADVAFGGGDDVLPPSPHPSAAAAAVAQQERENPIDHIFQFHKALRRELKELESEAIDLQAAADAAEAWAPGDPLSRAIQDLQARFQFLRGIYRAHSSSEDEVIFPALEAKETLHNVSHAYALDHAQEESLFEEVAEVIAGIGACAPPHGLPDLRALASRLARMCAAVRAALETHVRAEETELWPLFAENFTIEEQNRLVGAIIGRTGAEVLHTMLSWVKGSLDEEEHSAMMLSLKSASKATAFEQWLETQGVGNAAGVGGGKAAIPGAAAISPPAGPMSWEDEQREVLAEVAKYLAKHGIAGQAGGGGGGGGGAAIDGAGAGDPASVAADAANFRPGWEDIFKLNQKQLEVAVRRVSADATLEPQRKAYLIQHLMASRYIVAQQRRGAVTSAGGSSLAATPTVVAGQPDSGRAVPGPSAAAAAVAALTLQQQQKQRNAGPSCDDGMKANGVAPMVVSAPNPAAVAAATAAAATSAPAHPHRHYHDEAAGVLGCPHYRRRASLIAPCCGSEHVCRLCHDAAVPGHSLDRYAVTEMRCMECGTRQAVAQSCSACGAEMARYYCGICHLFDDDPDRAIYHCPFCNFCRRGQGLGVDSFHCMACNACMSLELFNKHKCTERALAGTCPVCSDPLFDSSAPIKELPCGHFMHSLCFGAYTRYSYACPVCSKTLGDMAVYWKMIDSLLEAEALPPEYAARRQEVLCNDCGAQTNARFHFVYHKCGQCGGYNTRVL